MYYLGIDFGGGSSKATLIDGRGKVILTSSSEYVTHYGPDGSSTQNPYDWYLAAVSNIKSILQNGINPEDIECVCFSAATHTAVLLGENDELLADAIYWTDTRPVLEKEYLLNHYRDYIFNKCKHLPDTIWTLPELMFLFREHPGIKEKVRHILFAKDYVRHLFCHDYVTDYIEAEGSMLFDFDGMRWDDDLLSILGIDSSIMPRIVKPLDIIGRVSEKASLETGLSRNTKVICGATDTAMEVFASGGVKKGDMTLKLATAGRICLVTDSLRPDKNIINYSHLSEGLYYPGSGTKSCAASFRWFRDAFGGSFDQLDELAETIPLGSNGLFFHPYLVGELTPLANPDVRASFFGISSLHHKGHFVRALYEGVGYSLLDCFLYLKRAGFRFPRKAYVLGGGAKSKLWRQIISDILGINLIVTENNDSSFGGALCCALSCGVFDDFEEASRKTIKIIGRVTPNRENHKKYLSLYRKYQQITKFTMRFYGKK